METSFFSSFVVGREISKRVSGGVCLLDVTFPRVHLSGLCLDRGIPAEKVRCQPEEDFSISSGQPGGSLIFLYT